ncbi:MAG: ubiquinol-cytochrome C chaperone family protein [Alphaproteobacteria bacterium]
MVWHLLFGSISRRKIGQAIYRSAVERARNPIFYREFNVSDSLDGRFDMIVIQVFLILHRLKKGSWQARRLSQEVFDAMFTDMDRSLREIGVGDLSVGRKVKTMAKALYGRIIHYDKGIQVQGEALAEALVRNLYRGQQPKTEVLTAMVHYVRNSSLLLDQQSEGEILKGYIDWGPYPVFHQT